MLFYTYKEIHNADTPYEIKNCDIATFQYCKNKTNNTDFTLIKPHVTSIIDLYPNKQRTLAQHQPINQKQHKQSKTRTHNHRKKQTLHRSLQPIQNTPQTKKLRNTKRTTHHLRNRLNLQKKTMKQYTTLFTASIDQEIIATMAFLETKTSIHAWLGGSKRLNVNKNKAKKISRANRLIIWHAIQYAKNKGIKEFDLGGIFTDKEVQTDPQKQGIRTFKKTIRRNKNNQISVSKNI